VGAPRTHLDPIRAVHPSSQGCEECLRTRGRWLHLRMCLGCGLVGCCDSSPGKHATKHFLDTGHPVMQPAEPGEDRRLCYVDRTQL